jgi:hypothetical protein
MAYRWTLEDLERLKLRNRVTTLPDQHGDPSTKSTKSARPKYGNRKVTDAEGNVHDSSKEYRRWCELQLRERAGEISELRRQVVFDIVWNGRLVCKYIADATYVENATGAKVVEDTKPDDAKFRKTLAYRHYKLKAALMLACHGIEVREV